MSDFFGKIKSGAGKVAFEADKMTRMNRAKGDLEKLKAQVQSQYAKLGETYYNQRATTGVTGPAFDEICQAIMNLEQQVAAKSQDIQRINAEVYTPQSAQPSVQPPSASAQGQSTLPPAPAAATTKFCPNCGRELQEGAKFCPDCGTKI